MEKQLKADGGILFYDHYNEKAENAVVLIHGFGLDADMWQDQIPVLEKYRVICIDVRGHGRSRPFNEFSVVLTADDIKKILHEEKCETAALIGLSMGGYVVQEFARLFPDITSGIMVADSTPMFISYPKWETISLKLSKSILRLYPWGYLKNVMAKQTSVKTDVRQKLITMFGKLSKEEFINSWSGIANVLHEENFDPNVTFYAVYGDKDKSGTIKLHAKDWPKHYPACKVFEISSAGHVSNMDNPDGFNRVMLEFLSAAFSR